MYFKFENKKAALDFCIEVNKGENIIVSEENVTTGYAQPFEFKSVFYVLADEVTSKYTDMEAIDLFAPIDTTPPTLYGLGVVIPEQFIWVFPDNKFILEGFEIPLTHGAVDIAYFQWQAFRDCLDNGNHEFLKRALMSLWDYVAEQVENQNFVVMLN
jgi:hypothetical protein